MKRLRTQGIETEIINAYDYEITPCSHCRYECFEAPKSCPIRDDVPEIWRRLRQAEGVVLAVPTYYGMPSALFKSLIERAQGVLDWVTFEFRNLESVWKGTVVAILIVSNGGGRSVLKMVSQQLPEARILSALFSYRDYGRTAYEGNLIQNPKVVSRLEKLADRMFSCVEELT
jgi:multimeric flavodoxin WrbA